MDQRVKTTYQNVVGDLIRLAGDNPTREGLRDTPERFYDAWGAMTGGIHEELDLRAFADGAQDYDEIVFEGNIPVYSLCEHHLLPFFGVAHIGYLPSGRIVGLSKLVRLVHHFSRRLQVQERMTQQIAKALESALDCRGVGVTIQCRHLCMEVRGVRTAGVETITNSLLGVFRTSPGARSEYLHMVSLVRR